MDILNSAWLIRMLRKSGASPQERLLSLFDILSDWADAPNIRASIQQPQGATNHLPANPDAPDHLISHLTEEAQACGAQLPEALAQQLYFIALGALQESLKAGDHTNFTHAKLAANALIKAQTERDVFKSKPVVYGMAACMMAIIVASGLFLYQHAPYVNNQQVAAVVSPTPQTQLEPDTTPSPKHAADMYASVEQMRHGDCQYVEALQIPDADKRVYIENVVGGKVPDNTKDMALALSYMQKIRCSYTPMLMKNSIN